jgi:hypothetical protein
MHVLRLKKFEMDTNSKEAHLLIAFVKRTSSSNVPYVSKMSSITSKMETVFASSIRQFE